MDPMLEWKIKLLFLNKIDFNLKGHWTTSASPPTHDFFFKVEIFIPLEVYT